MDKKIREGRSWEKEENKRKYEDYIKDKCYKSRLAAATGKRLPYHLLYIRMVNAGLVPGIRKRKGRMEGMGRDEAKKGKGRTCHE